MFERSGTRFQTASDLRFALESSSDKAAVIAPVGIRKRLGAILAAAAVVTLVFFGFVVLRRSSTENNKQSGRPRDSATAAATLDKARVLVLPLQSRGKEEADVGFAGGMTEALRGELSKIAGLRIIDGTLLANVQSTLPELARKCRELNSGSVLRGSVQQIGAQLRVHLELLNSQTAEVLWPYQETRAVNDIFGVQSDVAQGVARASKCNCCGGSTTAWLQANG